MAETPPVRPHRGELCVVWAAGPEPGPPDKGRAVIGSGRSAVRGVVGEGGGGARAGESGPLRGTDHCAAGGPGLPPPPPPAAAAPRDAARGKPLCSSWLRSSASVPHPHPPRPKGKGGGWRREATPPAGGSVRAPSGRGRGAAAGGGPERRGLRRRRRVWSWLWTAFNSGGKKRLSQGTKNSGVGWGDGVKNCKAQTATHVCRVD